VRWVISELGGSCVSFRAGAGEGELAGAFVIADSGGCGSVVQNGVVLAREDWAGTSSVFHSILVQVVL